MRAFRKVIGAIVALLGTVFLIRANKDEVECVPEFEFIPEFEADSEPPEFALTPPETDETAWYNDYKIVPAGFLPDGWNWKQYGDGSGSLKSPDGKGYFGYDLSTQEFEHPAISGNNWHFFDGYPYECISFAEFKKFAEQWIADNIITSHGINVGL